MRKKQDETEIPKGIEEITGLKIQNKIFDSDTDKWNRGTSSTNASQQFKKNVETRQ